MSPDERRRAAKAAYQRRHRAANPEMRERERLATRARYAALETLRARHQWEFRDIEELERRARGLPPVGASGVGRPPKVP